MYRTIPSRFPARQWSASFSRGLRSWMVLAGACLGFTAYSQTAIGLRAGETSGVTVKKFIGTTSALEGIAGVWYHGLSATVLYERYLPAFGAANTNWYFGGGTHVAFKTGTSTLNTFGQRRYYYRDGGLGLGIDAIFGLEYKMSSAPIAVSFDFKPFVEFNTQGGAWFNLDPGLQLKVIF